MTNSEPSPESVLHALHTHREGYSSLPSLAALQVVLGALEGDDSRSVDSMAPESFGRFQVEKELGHGGFGWVFLALDPTLNRRVALKVPRPDLSVSKELRGSLIAEAEATALLDHPNIVPVYEAGEVGSLVYIASAYCAGPTLSQWLHEQGGKTSARQAALIAACLADALCHAHEKGILHRDIKPANILLQQATPLLDSDELPFEPRLTDFGLAQRLDSSPSELPAGPVGTPRYMAPEQRAGGMMSERADVYGLGAVLYEMLTGEPPASCNSNRVSGASELLRRSGVSPDLAAICTKCLAVEPESRYSTAHKVASDLRRYLVGLPVTARPLRLPQRAVRWCRRHRALTGLSLSLIAVAAVGTLGIGVQRHYAEQHAVASRQAKVEAGEHLQQAQIALVELAWLVEESALWEGEDHSGRRALKQRLDDYHRNCIESGASDESHRAVLAAIHSFNARSAAASNLPDEAEKEFQEALARWRELVVLAPDDASHFRALVRSAIAYREFLTPSGRSAAMIDALITLPESTLAEFNGDLSAILLVRLPILTDLAAGHLHRNQRGRANLCYRWAADMQGALAEIEPEQPLHRLRQAQLLSTIRGYRGSPREEVQTARAEAMAILEDILVNCPEDDVCRVELAEVYRLQALGAREDRQPERARDGYAMAIALADEVLARDPGNRKAQTTLAGAARRLALLKHKEHEKLAALELIERTCNVWFQHFSDGTLSSEQLEHLALACHDCGTWAREAGRQELSREAYRRGVIAFEAQIEQMPMTRQDWIYYAECLSRTGNFQLADGDATEAVRSYEAARKILERLATKKQGGEPAVWARLRTVRGKLAELRPEPAE